MPSSRRSPIARLPLVSSVSRHREARELAQRLGRARRARSSCASARASSASARARAARRRRARTSEQALVVVARRAGRRRSGRRRRRREREARAGAPELRRARRRAARRRRPRPRRAPPSCARARLDAPPRRRASRGEREVVGLAADERARARRRGELAQRREPRAGRASPAVARAPRRRSASSASPASTADGLAVGDVHGRAAAALVVVVHARQVVVDERVGVDQLDGGRERAARARARRPTASPPAKRERRAQPLAAREEQVAHRRVERAPARVAPRAAALERASTSARALREVGAQVHYALALPASSKGRVREAAALAHAAPRCAARRARAARAQRRESATPSSKVASASSSASSPRLEAVDDRFEPLERAPRRRALGGARAARIGVGLGPSPGEATAARLAGVNASRARKSACEIKEIRRRASVALRSRSRRARPRRRAGRARRPARRRARGARCRRRRRAARSRSRAPSTASGESESRRAAARRGAARAARARGAPRLERARPRASRRARRAREARGRRVARAARSCDARVAVARALAGAARGGEEPARVALGALRRGARAVGHRERRRGRRRRRARVGDEIGDRDVHLVPDAGARPAPAQARSRAPRARC